MLRTRSCSRSASRGKPRRQRKPGPAGPVRSPAAPGCGTLVGPGRAAHAQPRGSQRILPRMFRGAALGRCGKRPGPWPRGPAGRCRPFVRTGGAPGASPTGGCWNKAIGTAGEPRQHRPGRPRGVRCAGPALRPGARLRPIIARGGTNPGGARGARPRLRDLLLRIPRGRGGRARCGPRSPR